MKVTIKENEQPKKPTVDWDKPQILAYNEVIVLSNGKHGVSHFTGTRLDNGYLSHLWDKSFFTPLPPSQSVILQND